MNNTQLPDMTKAANQVFFQDLSMDLENLKRMFDLLPLGVLAVDINGRIIYYNRAHAKLDQLTAPEVVGRLESEVFGFPDFSPGITRACRKMNRPILGFMCAYFTVKNPSRIINGAYWVFPLHGAQNEISGSVCFTMPITGKDQPVETNYLIWPEYMPLAKEPKVIIGDTEQMLKAVRVAKSKADSPSPVLISGETGTGKELFARLIHDSSHRAKKSFMAINCAAIPSNLLEGILFGTTKGSFTGALDKAGLFEEANGGTVYLDEADSMPMDLQPKLLRVLQEMTVRRLGATADVKLDVKIISSIGVSIKDLLDKEKIRSDLFYRLAVIIINIPPLRDRLPDIDEMINYFIYKYNKQLHKKVFDFDAQAKKWLLSYSWPGNVRELENLVAGAINMVEDDLVLTMAHLPEHYLYLAEKDEVYSDTNSDANHNSTLEGQNSQGRVKDDVLEANLFYPELDFGASLTSVPGLATWQVEEMGIITKHLKEARGKLTVTAASLGISRQLLRYKMNKYGLKRYEFLPKMGEK